jgi:hypothetical protein
MPITLTIDREKRVVYSALHGVIREDEFLQHINNIKSHPHFDAAFSDIYDLRGVTDVKASIGVLERIAQRPSVFNRDTKHVIIALKGLMYEWAEKIKELSSETRPNMTIVTSPEQAYEVIRA